MKRPSRLLLAAMIGLGVWAPAAAETTDTTSHVWTREDLERRYGKPSPSSTARDPAADETDRLRVEVFLARQYARLEADRDAELRRLEIAAEVEAAAIRDEREAARYVLTPAWRAWPYGWPCRRSRVREMPRLVPDDSRPPGPNAGAGTGPLEPPPRILPAWLERAPTPGTPAGPCTRGPSGSS